MTDYPALVGKIIAGKYRIDRLLGQGGMGLVYSGQHVDLARPVAVKLIRRELMETESVAERFLLEARAAAKIQSEHVGRVLDVGRLDTGEPYIVMEYLEGQDLAVHLEQYGRFEYPAAVDFILEACEALAEAHHHQIVHRDLKPENLFLASQPDGSLLVKVLDFGISKQLGETGQRALTSPATALGSPQYMSPEQMEGINVDVRSDIWALGAILYEMVTGRRTFDGETLAQVCVQVLSGNVTPVRSLVSDVPFELATAIEQCLRQHPDERFANVGAFARAIEPFGSERARISAQRVVAVLGMSGERVTNQGQRMSVEGRVASVTPNTGGNIAVSAATAHPGGQNQRKITPGSRPVSPVSRTEVATDAVAASSHTVTVNRSAARLPIFLGLLGVIGLGFGVWAFVRSEIGDARMRTTTPAEAQSALGAMAVPEEPGTLEVPVASVAPVTIESAAESAATAVESQTSSAAPASSVLVNPLPDRGVKLPKTSTVQPKPNESPSAIKPTAAEADPFGGRK